MNLRVELHPGLEGIDAAAWNAIAGDDDPFAEYEFLRALETSESVGRGTGWMPVHVTAWEGQTLVGGLPLYVKSHSYGEYIFDFGWAQAASQARIRYYPKLVSMTPFTPATGTRFLVSATHDYDTVVTALVAGVQAGLEETKSSSAHLLFLNERERLTMAQNRGFFPRLSTQFHWHSRGDKTFDEYLSHFRAEPRKQVRRERRKVVESGLQTRIVEGVELTETEWQSLDTFYRDTCDRKGSEAYLSPDFFEHLRASEARKRVVAALAYDGERLVAGTLNFEKGKHLYGRYWGCLKEYDALHFELCYYMLIERAIARGYDRFEAGAQGTHKLKRGLLPAEVHSAHFIADRRLGEGVADYVAREGMMVKREIEELMHESPMHREHHNEVP